jgi:uncharacterized protein YutE (UPF0331/DUF86 family)
MVNKDLVAAKLVELADRLARVRQHRRTSADALLAERDALELVSFNLMLAVQVCADIALHLAADEGWPAPRNLAEGFARLAEHGVIGVATAAALGRAVRLRNVIAHGYSRVDVAAVHAGATTGLADIERFAREVAAWVEAA